jgi:hypothetical protein
MGRIVSAVFAASRWSLFWLLRRRSPRLRRHVALSQAGSRRRETYTVDTLFGERRLVMTPAQAAAFVTRSATWRCVSCGKVHAFDMPVRVGAASPCSCLQIEFETEVRRRPAARYIALRGLSEG